MMENNSKKHILIYSIHYLPEMIGIGIFNGEMARYLNKKGYDITVVTAFPWYPYWKVMDEYRGRFFMTEVMDDIKVKRSYVWTPKNVNSITRILLETVFSASSLLNLFPLIFKKVDVVFAVCPPLQIGLAAHIFCRLKRIPLIFHVQDLQVDAAFDMGMIKNRFLINMLKGVERYIFKGAAVVATISNGMKRKIVDKGIDECRVYILPNWADTDFIKPMQRNNRFRDEYGITGDRFLVLYAGNIGEKQGVDIIIDAAQMTRDKKEILYMIAGEGANRARLKAKVDEKGLDNIMLLPLQSREMLPYMLAAADVSLIIQKNSVGDIVMPSKFLNIMASMRPVIATANSECELARVIKEVECGLVVEPENPNQLKDAVLKLHEDKSMRDRCGGNGRRYVMDKFSKETVLERFDKEIGKMLYCAG